MKNYDVIIIGSGPTGIAAAESLIKSGITNIVIVEREQEAGGVPRHCQHPVFGYRVFKRLMKGNIFTKKILSKIKNVEILLQTSVIKILPHGILEISSQHGLEKISAKKILIATGARETPRHPRLTSGERPIGIMTTGALQQFIYLNKMIPCKNPVIIGSEMVSFSALLTLRAINVKAQAIIETNSRITSYKGSGLIAKALGTPIYLNHKIIDIIGKDRVEKVILESTITGQQRIIPCDAMIFSGEFIGETTLIRSSHLDLIPNTGIPRVDQYGRCSDSNVYAAGNMLHPVDRGDACFYEGQQIGQQIAQDLKKNQVSDNEYHYMIHFKEPIAFTIPNSIQTNNRLMNNHIDLVMKTQFSGIIKIISGTNILYEKQHTLLPTRKISLQNINWNLLSKDTTEIIIETISF